ncbi:MAG: SIR2 family protein, partial [Thermodesulfobacteriota bacterium]
MPAFITNGPDIPERLLQAHEEGNVVFFCGSGISYPAGLPDFGGLVKAIYDQVGVCPNDVQHAAIKTGRYDTAVGLLEDDIAGGREKVRKAISEILTPDFTKPKSMATHEALLKLGQDRKGRVRLITTNFDRIFEEVITKRKIKIERFMAPLLPIPKNQWDGLVYLHGLLPSLPKEGELDRLVVSSGDFGLAYLTERWASRFVSELFRRYSVCFVGYSINDPVLRYMVDALAVDRSLGESRPEMFAFGSYSKGKEKQAHDEWKAKRVTPILYRKYRKHIYLHRTLQEWSRTYRDGVRGKEMIIAQHASTRPLAPSRSDFAVGRVLWALTDEVAAKHFADMNPVPPLKWLEPLSERQFGYEDLPRFGVTADSKRDEKLQFSILDRPAPYTLSPWMCIADRASPAMNWDNIMSHLARWLTRHMNDPALILWLAKSGGQLHELFLTQLSRGLERLDRLKAEGKLAEINQIRSDSPNAIPNPLMRTLWRLLISGRVKSYVRHAGFFDWLGCLKREGLTPLMRMELRENLKPCVTLREPYHWGEPNERLPGPERIKDLVDWDIALHSDDVHSTLRDQADNTHWLKVLPDLLPDFFCLLRDTLDLMGELGGADEKSDFSYIHQPSISDHPQNRNFQDWTVLIELVRDAWLCVVQVDKTRARRAAEEWWQQPYPVFKRLAFFAAAQKNIFPPRQGLNWILADDGWWLWAVETTRETLRLLVALAPQLSPLQTTKMEQAILTGPPREMFKDDIDPEELTRIVDREVWLRLAKLEKSGAKLGTAAK